MSRNSEVTGFIDWANSIQKKINSHTEMAIKPAGNKLGTIKTAACIQKEIH